MSFSFSIITLNMSFHCVLITTVSVMSQQFEQIFKINVSAPYVMCHFLLDAFKILSLTLVFSSFLVMFLGIIFLHIYPACDSSLSIILNYISFFQLGNFVVLFSQIYFHFLFFPSGDLIRRRLDIYIDPHVTEMCCFFPKPLPQFFFFGLYFWFGDLYWFIFKSTDLFFPAISVFPWGPSTEIFILILH